MGVKAKLKRSSPKVLNAWLLFVTILVIVFSFLYYSFVFVKNNEKGQIENRFIVLAQIGKNVMDRKKGFEFISETALKRVKKLKKITRKVEKLNEPENATDQKNQEKATDKLKELRILIQKEIKKANECLMVDQRDKEDKKEQKVSFQRNRLILGTWEINGKNKEMTTINKFIGNPFSACYEK